MLIAVLLARGGTFASPDRRRAIVHLGVGLAIAGVVVIVSCQVTRSIALGHLDHSEERAAAGAIWDAFLGDLRNAGWILAGAGAVVAAAAASVLRPVDLGEPLHRVGRALIEEPRRPWLRVVRAVGLLAAGVLLLLEPNAMLNLAITLAGVYLIYEAQTRCCDSCTARRSDPPGSPVGLRPRGDRGGWWRPESPAH